jgi:adenine-specific DNA glycosylase
VLIDPRGHTLLLAPPQAAQAQLSRDEISALASKMWHFPTVAAEMHAEEELLNFLQGLPRNFGKTRRLILRPVARVRHTVTYRAITVHVFRAPVAHLPLVPDAKTISLSELAAHSSLAISNLTRKIALAALANSPLTVAVQPEALSFAQP